MPKICIDPGHNTSGADTGAQGNGLFEQDLTLDIARRFRTLLEFNGFDVVMTRDGDFVNGPHGDINESLKSRCDIANSSGADLFISIHINAGGGTGSEVYCLPGGKAVHLAGIMAYYFAQQLSWPNRGVNSDHEFYVLVHTGMSAILTENGFIDNASDAVKLADSNFRQTIARAHAKGTCEYFAMEFKEPAPQTAPQQPEQTEQPAQPDKVVQAIDLLNKAIAILKD
ncbi:MAG: N-acetylmuramoyl-L-alanine amidase [Desulfitobacteriaceae bacterium]